MSRRRGIDAQRLRALASAAQAMNHVLAGDAAAARARALAAEEEGRAIVAALNVHSELYDITLSVVPAALQKSAAERDTAERAADAASASASQQHRRINAMHSLADQVERREAAKRAAHELEAWQGTTGSRRSRV
ncbi:MAG: hypothetical protein AAF580_00880 [Pseudomonadota bacterium]